MKAKQRLKRKHDGRTLERHAVCIGVFCLFVKFSSVSQIYPHSFTLLKRNDLEKEHKITKM